MIEGFAIVSAIVLILVSVYTVIAVRKQAAAARRRQKPNPALKQLEERYERGEMSKKEYRERKKRLRK